MRHFNDHGRWRPVVNVDKLAVSPYRANNDTGALALMRSLLLVPRPG